MFEKVSPVGYPKFEPKSLDEGQDLEFVAIFEVYPDLELAELSGIKLEKPEVEIKEKENGKAEREKGGKIMLRTKVCRGRLKGKQDILLQRQTQLLSLTINHL